MTKTKADQKTKREDKPKAKLTRMKKYKYHYGWILRIYPSDRQKAIIKKNYDAQRFVYNTLVGDNRQIYYLKKTTQACYKAQRFPYRVTYRSFICSFADIEREKEAEQIKANIATPKKIKDRFFFLQDKDIDSLALANANKNYNKAWKNYCELGHGIPTFHKKSNDWSYQTNCQYNTKYVDTPLLDNGSVCFIDQNHIQLPKLGKIRTSKMPKILLERLQAKREVRIGTATIKRSADGHFTVSIQLGSNLPFAKQFAKTGSEIGIDLNTDNFLTESNGAMVGNPRYYRKALPRLKRMQRSLSRKQRRAKKEGRSLYKAKNYQKQRLRVAKLQAKVRRQRHAFLDYLSTVLIKNHDLIVAEELRSKNMLKNHALAMSISDAGWRTFLTMLEYKAKLHGKIFITINPAYTTQRCNICGNVMGRNGQRKLTLKDRDWVCPNCGTYHVRDWNAAINIIEKYKIKWKVRKGKQCTKIIEKSPIVAL